MRAQEEQRRQRVVLAPDRRQEDERRVEQADRRRDDAGPHPPQVPGQDHRDGGDPEVPEDQRQLEHERRHVRAAEAELQARPARPVSHRM